MDFVFPPLQVLESDGDIIKCLQIVDGELKRDISVQLSLANGTAVCE